MVWKHARRWTDGGQTVDNGGQTVDRRWTEQGETVDRAGETVDRRWTDGGQTVDRRWTDGGQNGGRLRRHRGVRDGVGIQSLFASTVVGKRGARRGAN
jgi:hypothetical protein